MNNNFDFNSKKFSILLILVLFMFSIFVIKMFDYIPVNDVETDNIVETQNFNNLNNSYINKQEQATENNKEKKEEYDEEYKNKHKSGHIDFMPKFKVKNEEYEEIQAPAGTNEEQYNDYNNDKNLNKNSDEQALNLYLNGQKYKLSSDYTNALNQFQKVIDIADNNELKAMSCEAIAEMYAIEKKYDIALSFAEKANSLSPSDSRAILISRIQYVSGDTETSIKNLNQMLQKGF